MPKVEKMRFATYLAVIKNSVGTRMFTEGYARVDGVETDVMRHGELSCAFYASSLLKIFNLVSGMHATVTSTVKDMEKSGWQKTKKPTPGDVIIWKPIKFPDGEKHEHIGFVVDQDEAISNDYVSGTPQKHEFERTPDGTRREIEAIYRGRHLFESD